MTNLEPPIRKSDTDNIPIIEKSLNVLILQGMGSLGAFGCGVYKALVKNNIDLDIIAGTSIGGINAAIIASKRDGNTDELLEDFWLELSEGFIDIDKLTPLYGWSTYVERLHSPSTIVIIHISHLYPKP